MARDIGSILELDDKGLSLAKSPCATMLRSTLCDLNVSKTMWDKKLDKYLKSPRSGIADTSSARSSKRSNLNRAIASDRVTWDTYREVLMVLNPKAILFKFNFVWDEKIILPKPKVEEIVYERASMECELTRIFREIFHSVGGDLKTWHHFIDRYLNKVYKGKKINPVDRATERSNLNRTILKATSLTWETFLKTLSIMGIDSGLLTVELVWSDVKHTLHEYKFDTEH